MGNDILIPRDETVSEPFSRRYGLDVFWVPRLRLGTAVSEGSPSGDLGHSLGAELQIAENFGERYNLTLEFPFGPSEGKLFPSTFAEGTTTDNYYKGVHGGFGRTTRSLSYFGDSGNLRAALETNTTPEVGRDWGTISPRDRMLGGERFTFEETNTSSWGIGTRYSLMAALYPAGRGPAIRVGPTFHYGVRNGQGLDLDIGFMIQAGIGDASTKTGANADTPLGPMGTAQGLYTLFHSWGARYAFINTLARQKELVDESGLLPDSGGDRGSLENLPALEGGAAISGALGSSLTPALRTTNGWFWGFTALRAAGGVAFAASGSESGVAGGVADLLGSARLVGYAIADIESPQERIGASDDAIQRRQTHINLLSWLANTVVFLGGAAAGSRGVMGAGANANLQVSVSPDSLERGMTERTDIYYVPVSHLSGERGGSRGGVIAHRSWHNIPSDDVQLFSSVMFMSPAFSPSDDTRPNTDVDAALGLEWKTTYTRLSAGVDTKAVFGGGDSAKAGLGVVGGFDVILPFNGQEDGAGLTFGVRAEAHKLFPSGTQTEIMPAIGFGGHL